jgi:GAF domain
LPPGVPGSVAPSVELARAAPELPRGPALTGGAAPQPRPGRVLSSEPPSAVGLAPSGPLRPSAPGDEDASWLEPDLLLATGEDGEPDELLALEAEPIPLVQRPSVRAPSSAPSSETRSPARADSELDSAPAPAALSRDAASAGSVDAATERPPDSGPGWQSPEHSGEYLIPLPEESLAPPSSQRVPAGDELMDVLFERMHELSGVLTVTAAADYVLGMLGEHIAGDGVLISGLDSSRGELVVIRASGARGRELIGWRVPLDMAPRGPALREGRSLELGPAELARSPGLWRALGVTAAHALVAPLSRQGRLLGSIELCRSAERGPFSPGHADALGLVCEQLAELIGDRSLDLARASLLPKP